jgi:hypothetical protein
VATLNRRKVSGIEEFSDAVFVFGVTLLVVSLEVPHIGPFKWALGIYQRRAEQRLSTTGTSLG